MGISWLATLIDRLLWLYSLVLLARVLASWLPARPDHPAMRLLHDLTEPVLAPLRRWLPPVPGIDYSPVVAFFLITVLQQIVARLVL